ncbi:hypothetical protein LOTGIDRAFT_158020 [Lottia gigantea]|uniref:Gluconokinase n=1 Tax=Lottia gigantea TaxID=225164 RepID=V4B2P6_LOTGI|nr:hypothetical protein LOTGIDRAFT_158020 [Lottia gigantea]ESP00727.1 hypothetical protein LOTGIDRAFT_158020 [Lottia gigantea]
MGVCGCGKTSVGTCLSEKLNCEFRDADSFHSEENKSKMASGTPLTDQDRIPWLTAIHNYITEKCRNDETMVVTCSALKKSYRNILKSGNPDNASASDTSFKLIFLKGDEDILLERLQSRKGHFMPASMLKSQLSTLEEPNDDENCLVVDIRTPVNCIVDTILS